MMGRIVLPHDSIRKLGLVISSREIKKSNLVILDIRLRRLQHQYTEEFDFSCMKISEIFYDVYG